MTNGSSCVPILSTLLTQLLTLSFSVGTTLLIKTPIFSHLIDAFYLIARLTSTVLSASPTIPSLEVSQLELTNNNHAALAERFQPSTLHKVRQLGRYTNTDTPDTAHQLDAEAVPAEVAHTRTNTQLRCLGGGESDRVPNSFKEGMAGLRHYTS